MLRQTAPSKLLQLGAKKLNISLSPDKIEKFLIYLEELKNWNKKINLTALRENDEIVIKHFLDSLSCYLVMEKIPDKLIDIGTGAGFPSIPLKIFLPKIKCTLIEAREKKIAFLLHLTKKLNLQNVTIIKARAEEVAKEEKRESFDLALGRAVARLNVLLEYALPYVKVGGYLIAQKGASIQGIKKAENALFLLGGKIRNIKYIKLPFLEQPRSLILIQKIKTTPFAYPRRVGIPQKRPL